MVNLPVLSNKTFFKIGFCTFLVQSICSISLFFINIRVQNFFSTTATWAGIVFSLVLSYFFLTMALNEGGSVKVADNDFKEILEEIEKTKKGDLFDR